MRLNATVVLAVAALLLAAASVTQAYSTGPISLNNYDYDLYQGYPAGPNPTGIFHDNLTTPAPLGTWVQVLFGTTPGNLSVLPDQSSETQWTVTESDAGNYGAWGGYFDVGLGYTNLPNNTTGVYFEMLAWSGATSYTSALATPGAWSGHVEWQQAVGSWTGPPGIPQAPKLYLPGPTIMHLTPAPEPSTLILGGIGAVALLAFGWVRRQK